MSSLSSFLAPFGVLGFSGSRQPSAAARWAARLVLGQAAPAGARVFTGDAAGIDVLAASLAPDRVRVFRARDFGAGAGAFAARSAACVRAVRDGGGCWVSLPCSAPPLGLLPAASAARCFAGFGSGSWASLAFALGLGVPSLVWLGGQPAPAGWGLSRLPDDAGWWVSSPGAGPGFGLFA